MSAVAFDQSDLFGLTRPAPSPNADAARALLAAGGRVTTGRNCARCGSPADRSLAAEWLCHVCFETVMAPIRERVILCEGFDGVGLMDGPVFGPGAVSLRCNSCSATWIGVPMETCWWCARSLELARKWQARIVLTAPDVEATDVNYDSRMRAWLERLVVAVDAGLITETDARLVVRRAA
jgi:hypothetical protein